MGGELDCTLSAVTVCEEEGPWEEGREQGRKSALRGEEGSEPSPGNKPTNRILWNTPSLLNLRPWD